MELSSGEDYLLVHAGKDGQFPFPIAQSEAEKQVVVAESTSQ
jgi:hypothetical protein